MTENNPEPKLPSNANGLRDPIWQFVAVPIGIVAIIATIIIAFYFQQRREISVKVAFTTVLKNDQTSLGSRIKILFDSREVDGISVNELKFKNTGNTAIIPADYIEPITVESKDCKILASDTVKSNPEWLADSIKIERVSESKIKISPILFNPNEDFSIRLLTNECNSGFYFKSRVIGVNELKFVGSNANLNWIGWFSVPLVLALFFFIGYGSSGEASQISYRLSKLHEARREAEKRYLFEPERTSVLKKVDDEIQSVKEKYKKADKSRLKVSTTAIIFIGILIIGVFVISTSNTF